MAERRVVMKIPTVELDGRDVELVMHIDRRKQGTLRVSQGGLDWQPARQRTSVVSATWSELIDWLES